MLRIKIKGEEFSFDDDQYTLREAIEIERGTGQPFGVWQTTGLGSWSAVSMGGLVWAVLKRAGRDVPIADIMSGKYELDIGDIDVVREDAGEYRGGPYQSPLGGARAEWLGDLIEATGYSIAQIDALTVDDFNSLLRYVMKKKGW